MICQSCNQNVATVHLTEIVSKQKNEVHLCEDCAREKGITHKPNVPVQDLLSAVSAGASAKAAASTAETSAPTTTASTACPKCGLTFGEFRSSGRLGCPDDYEHFKRGLVPLLEKIHGATQHVGKIPHAVVGTDESKSRQLSRLRQQLNTAVQREEYERAAELRDQIQTLEAAVEDAGRAARVPREASDPEREHGDV